MQRYIIQDYTNPGWWNLRYSILSPHPLPPVFHARCGRLGETRYTWYWWEMTCQSTSSSILAHPWRSVTESTQSEYRRTLPVWNTRLIRLEKPPLGYLYSRWHWFCGTRSATHTFGDLSLLRWWQRETDFLPPSPCEPLHHAVPTALGW